MTMQTFVLLRTLASLQPHDGAPVILIRNKRSKSSCYIVYNGDNLKTDFRRLKYSYEEAQSRLRSLQKEGKIRLEYSDTKVYLDHDSWHRHQHRLFSALSFLLKSVIVPIAVSIATTLLTLWAEGLLPF